MPQLQHLYFGLDLGKRKDYSALSVVEFSRPFVTFRNPVTWEMQQEFEEPRYAVRQLTRIPLDTKYIDVVDQIRAKLFKAVRSDFDCTLVVDATGVGQPVVEMFQALPSRAKLVPVVITSGARGSETKTRDEWRVPKQDLVSGLQIMLETGVLKVANGLQFSAALLEELLEFREGISAKGNTSCEGPQDDLVLATALAAWRARLHEPPGANRKTGFRNIDIGINGVGSQPNCWGKTRLF